jgi:alkanesulfonate monooxygenase SsuD/methylene tetrahydromethanopterin reductase-like flavin-dependent oxidoreductase (luciferase family)
MVVRYMQYGFILPGGDIHTLIELAIEAEVAGWDGIFYWDAIYIESAGLMYDPWVSTSCYSYAHEAST